MGGLLAPKSPRSLHNQIDAAVQDFPLGPGEDENLARSPHGPLVPEREYLQPGMLTPVFNNSLCKKPF